MLKAELSLQYRLEEEYWRTKSRIQWLQAGDRNTRFFHSKTKQRRSYNRIIHISDEEAEINDKLTQEVTDKEIEDAAHAINPDKSPGPDGMNAGFFRHHWETIKQVMKQMGFCETWCKWIHTCVSTVTFSVLVNGEPSKPITPTRGIRQVFCRATEEECQTLMNTPACVSPPQLAHHRLRKKPEEIAGPLVSPELRYPQSLRRNHLFSLLLHHVGGLSQTIEISPDTTKLPTTREIIVLPALSTRGRDQSKHEIISAFEPLKTLDARIENHLIVDLTDFTSAESFIIKTRTPPPCPRTT
ncbi:PREDICTED: uncharacterized protein LOC106339195 [Brassica oleracea var. oleracea]|uniref:uncharacterized protein LOC106339195 n=1 Tax=Brassica oleracea var. oleracea TaxID=109376 RepID=UPI0006A6C239|nr:PREDICTED: uncharacterized protein LOC106339195 [Brassica oleracea var. oleracea]